MSVNNLRSLTIVDAHGFGNSLPLIKPVPFVSWDLPFNDVTGMGVEEHSSNSSSWVNTLNVIVYVFFFFLLW